MIFLNITNFVNLNKLIQTQIMIKFSITKRPYRLRNTMNKPTNVELLKKTILNEFK